MLGAIWALICGGAIVKDGLKGWGEDIAKEGEARRAAERGENFARIYYDHKGRKRSIDTNEIVHYSHDKNGDEWLVDSKGRELRNLTKEKKAADLRRGCENYDRLHTVILYQRIKGVPAGKVGFAEYIYQDVLYSSRKYVVRRFGINHMRQFHEDYMDKLMIKFLGEEKAKLMWELVFFMDTSTGMLVRLSDSFLRDFEKGKERSREEKIESITRIWDKRYIKDEMIESALKRVLLKEEKTLEYAEEFIAKFNEYQKERKDKFDLSYHKDFKEYYLCDSIHHVYSSEIDSRRGF